MKKLYFIFLFASAVLFTGSNAKGALIEGFEGCTAGQNTSECTSFITQIASYGYMVSSAHAESGANSIVATTTLGVSSIKMDIATSTYKVIDVYFRATEEPNSYAHFDILGSGGSAYIGFSPTNNLVLNSVSTTTQITAGPTYATWHFLTIEFDPANGYVKGWYDGANETTIMIDPAWTEIHQIGFFNNNAPDIVFWDSIQDRPCTSLCTSCDYQGCAYYNEFCSWNFATGDCTQIETTNSCGPDWLCNFCVDSSTCQANGCSWYNGYCWSYLNVDKTPWHDYYASNSDYATATGFIESLASSTSGFYETIRTITTNFGNIFNASSAQSIGSTTGSIIPKVRGYMNLANGFFGNIPIAEIFVISLSLLFASIIWQVAKGIIGMIKPM